MAGTVFAFGPYKLDVMPGPSGFFRWIIRQDGRLLHRSATLHTSEEEAKRDGMAEIERLLVEVRRPA